MHRQYHIGFCFVESQEIKRVHQTFVYPLIILFFTVTFSNLLYLSLVYNSQSKKLVIIHFFLFFRVIPTINWFYHFFLTSMYLLCCCFCFNSQKIIKFLQLLLAYKNNLSIMFLHYTFFFALLIYDFIQFKFELKQCFLSG